MTTLQDVQKILRELEQLYKSKPSDKKCLPPCKQIIIKCPPPSPSPETDECKVQKPCKGITRQMRDEEQDLITRYANFYNNYNLDYKNPSGNSCCCPPKHRHREGQTVDGKDPNCPQFHPNPPQKDKSQCNIKLKPPSSCDPNLNWTATFGQASTKTCVDYRK